MNLTSDQVFWNGLFPQPSTNDDASDFAYLHPGKIILVTGAGGSIGSALAKPIHRFRPRCLLLIDSSEQALYRIHSDLSQAGWRCHVRTLGPLPMSAVFAILCNAAVLRSSITPTPLKCSLGGDESVCRSAER